MTPFRKVAAPLVLLALALLPLRGAATDRAGDFAYYILALSWVPAWCEVTGDGRADPTCARGAARGFTVHGLWPQHETGWPEFCRTSERDPTRGETAAMAGLMGSAGLAWYQWRKHGRCSGLSARAYFEATREAASRVTLPPVFELISRDMRLTETVIAEAFREANPALPPDGLMVRCEAGTIREVRICLTRDLEFRACGADVLARACGPAPRRLPALR